MVSNSFRTHPLIVVAATTVILTCLLAIGMMTGIVPSPLARERGTAELTSGAAQPARDTPAPASQNAYAPDAPTANQRNASAARSRANTAATAPVGSTRSAGPSQTVAGGAPASVAAPDCTECGSVSSVRAVREQGEAGLIGPAAGGLIGGVLGHQIGSGRGNTIATVVGAAGGAAVGTEIERRQKSTTHYVVSVRLNDGRVRQFNYPTAPGFQTGEKVRVVDGRLVRE